MALNPILRGGRMVTRGGRGLLCEPECYKAKCGPCPSIPGSVIARFFDLDGHFNLGNYCDPCDDDATFGNDVPHLLTYRPELSTPTNHLYRKDFSPGLCTFNPITKITFGIGCAQYWDDLSQTGWTFGLSYGGDSQTHFQWSWFADASTGNPVVSGTLAFLPGVAFSYVTFDCSGGSLVWPAGFGSGDSTLACAVPSVVSGAAGRATVEWAL